MFQWRRAPRPSLFFGYSDTPYFPKSLESITSRKLTVRSNKIKHLDLKISVSSNLRFQARFCCFHVWLLAALRESVAREPGCQRSRVPRAETAPVWVPSTKCSTVILCSAGVRTRNYRDELLCGVPKWECGLHLIDF